MHLKSLFTLSLLLMLSACPSQNIGQSVNITIDKELLEKVTGKLPEGQASTPPVPEASPPINGEEEPFIQTPDVDLEAEEEAMFQVVYDIANGLNNWDIVSFNQALHPNSAFAANMPAFFNQLVEAGTTHQINQIEVEEHEGNSAVLWVNRYSTAYGFGKTEDLFYDIFKVNDEWKLLQIRSADGAY